MDREVTVKFEDRQFREAVRGEDGSSVSTISGRWIGIFSILALAFVLMTPEVAEAAPGEDLFSQHCASCHALSSERVVGPGLAEVVEERDRDWLIRKIIEPDRLAREGDSITAELVSDFGMEMPNLGIAEDQADAIVSYLASADVDGAAPVDQTFTESQAEQGRALFEGSIRFENRGVSCNACHNVDHGDVFGGGSLAADLTDSYSRLGAAGMNSMLDNPPFPVMRVAYEDKPLTEEEIASLTAFLEQAAQDPAETTFYGANFLGSGLLGTLLLFGLFSFLWRGRRRKSVNQSIYDRQVKSR